MSKKQLSILIASLFVAVPVFAQSGPLVQGSVSVGGLWKDVKDGGDEAKFQEYRDLSEGALTNIDLKTRSGNGWLDIFGENFARDDMYFDLKAGWYGMGKGRIYTDHLPHNFVLQGLTPYAGAGTGTQTATFPSFNTLQWNSLDVGYQRKDTGFMVEFSQLSPWYFRVDGNSVRLNGSKLGSAANGTSPGNGFVDLAFPVNYETKNGMIEGGYTGKTMSFSLSWTGSRFENDTEAVKWTNPFFGGNQLDTSYLAPDNKYQRFKADGTVRALPFGSTLAGRFTWDKLESTVGLPATTLHTGGIYTPTLPNTDTFNGSVKNTTFSVSLASMPMKALDTRVWYNYYDRENESTHVEYAGTSLVACGGAPCDNELYAYTKHNFGIDAYWRLNRANRFAAGWDYWDVERHRPDYDETTDNKFFVEWKNTSLDSLSVRVKYQYLDRDSNFLLGNEGANANDVLYLERFIGRYDAMSLKQNQAKVVLDWAAMPMLDFSFEGIWKETKYKEATLTRTKDRRWEVYGNVSWGDPSKVRVSAFADYERIKYDSYHRNIGAGSCPTTSGGVTATDCFDPNTPPNTIAYNWSAVNEDENWVLGVGVDWPVMDRLMIKASYLYYKTDGSADIQAQNNIGNPFPITAYDDTKKQSLNLRAIYALDKNISVTGGYSYEKYDYSDDQYNNYLYVVPPLTTSASYLNGYMADLPYKAHIFYVLGTYRF